VIRLGSHGYSSLISSFHRETFKKTVTVARSLGMVNLGHISTDGTKIKAKASNNYTLSKEEIEKARIEHNLVCTAHNLKVMRAKMTGKVAVLGKIGV